MCFLGVPYIKTITGYNNFYVTISPSSTTFTVYGVVPSGTNSQNLGAFIVNIKNGNVASDAIVCGEINAVRYLASANVLLIHPNDATERDNIVIVSCTSSFVLSAQDALPQNTDVINLRKIAFV